MEADSMLTVAHIVDLMRATKKTDPLFKPLKKLKTALQSIGLQNVSMRPTRKMVIFHFGLGNDLDRQFIDAVQPKGLAKNIQIIPGNAYCLSEFVSPEAARDWCRSELLQMSEKLLFYREVQRNNLKRVLVALFTLQEFRKDIESLNCQDCSRKYGEGTIPGIRLVEEAITEEKELELLKWIDKQEWSRLNNRRVQHYGFEFRYGKNQVDKNDQKGQLPEYFTELLQCLTSKIPQLRHSKFDQLTINDYFAGDGIPPHFDTHSPFEEVFMAVSMLSGIVMDFRKYDGVQKSVYLPPRSVCVFSGEGRYAWTHGIACRKADLIDGHIQGRSRRISLTFRQIRYTPCPCPYYFYCDSQGYDQNTMKKHNPLLLKYLSSQHQHILGKLRPEEIEQKYVEEAYNGFGFDFHNRVIGEVKEWIQKDIQAGSGDIVLDLGCGNGEYGKYLPEGVYYFPVEKCRNMCVLSDLSHMEGRRLCLRSCSVDRLLLVAVLHHMASEESRLEVLRESLRVLRPGGAMYLSVLAYQGKEHIYEGKQILLEYCLSSDRISKKGAQKQHEQKQFKMQEKIQKENQKEEKQQREKPEIKHKGDNRKSNKEQGLRRQVPRIQQRGEIYQRYYHLFTEPELTSLVRQAGFAIDTLSTQGQNILCKAFKQSKPIVSEQIGNKGQI